MKTAAQAIFRLSGRSPTGSRLADLSTAPGSIRRDAGVLDDLRPQRDIGLDDVGEPLERRALRLASGGVKLLLQVRCRQCGLQRLADAFDDSLRRGCRHD